VVFPSAVVLHLRKQFIGPPVATAMRGIHVRSMTVPDDVQAWLMLRDRAMAGLMPRARSWTEIDFFSQLASKPWWRPERVWLACDMIHSPGELVGAVMLAMREGKSACVPVVHWLLVDPAWRRRGIGRMLVSYLERAAWDAGWREVQLETHSGWAAAVAFYQSIGYAPLRDRSPR
jgi:GNAT superfamily N-acetyltransferase